LKKILVVEDETAIREFEIINLRRAGYEVMESGNGDEAMEIFKNHSGNLGLVILDIMIPGISGIELCKEFRRLNEFIGIILLTAKSQEIDKVSGLMYGADDYVTKPFSPAELLARVDALYRRVVLNAFAVKNNFKEEVKFDGFVLNFRNQILKKGEKVIELTHIEFLMLEYFIFNENVILKRVQIMQHVWKKDGDEKIVDVNIRRLRMKIEDDPSKPKHILTVWGVGYKWNT
jgi:DNA-binding response OmpR family regulator